MVDAPRVLTLVGSSDASSMYRVFQPSAELERQGYIAHWANNQDQGLELATLRYGYEIIVLNRLSWAEDELPQAQAFIDQFHRRGVKVVYESGDMLPANTLHNIAGITFRQVEHRSQVYDRDVSLGESGTNNPNLIAG